jgi:hypothetical protein
MHGVTRYGKLVILIATSKRLQVLLDDAELREIQRAARAQKTTGAAWVRQALRATRIQAPMGDAKRKLEVVRAAVRHSYSSGDIEQMIAEIEHGYGMGHRCLR